LTQSAKLDQHIRDVEHVYRQEIKEIHRKKIVERLWNIIVENVEQGDRLEIESDRRERIAGLKQINVDRTDHRNIDGKPAEWTATMSSTEVLKK
jgi:hypothetical protein